MSTTYTTLMPSLEFNGRLKQFESFFSHQGIPFMFNFAGEFISVRNEQQEVDGENGSETKYTTTLWLNNKGKYGEFYGRYHDSQIEYYVNPDAMTDKVFDNLQYRMDAYKRNGENNEWE
ncbi:MAG: hypothetical protein LBL24_00825 [Bacteroidales bacterium]|jgi:hypothetical protein|nr:hypothetical protein [Bacteroidales bacterium]